MPRLAIATAIAFLLGYSAASQALATLPAVTSGLVAHYSFEGNASDESGNSNHGTVTGAVLTSDRNGLPNAACDFDANGDAVVVANSPSLNPPTAITVAAWYRPVSFGGTGSDPIVDKAFTSHSAPYYQYHLSVTGNQYVNTPGSFGFSVATGGVNNSVNTPNNFWTAGNWYHVVGTYDSTLASDNLALYVNGSLIGTTSATGAIADYGQDLLIGKFGNLSNSLFGTIDEVSIYNRALSFGEVQQIAGVPEPHSLILAVVGMLAFGLRRSR